MGSGIAGLLSARVLADRFDEVMLAELVIDATGAGSQTPKWIADLGYERPAESVVNCDFAYTSVFMRPRDPAAMEGNGFMVFPPKQGEYVLRGAALVRMKDGSWLRLWRGVLATILPAN